jgi:hypothetical protein
MMATMDDSFWNCAKEATFNRCVPSKGTRDVLRSSIWAQRSKWTPKQRLISVMRSASWGGSWLVRTGWPFFGPQFYSGHYPPSHEVTWLILPVVICLSQRLSHACLSINNFILWNCAQLIISAIIYLMVPHYMDNRSNSRANTCVKSRLSGEGCIY